MKKIKLSYKYNTEYYGHELTINGLSQNINKKQKPRLWLNLLTGAIIGFVNGFWGGGGGMICVPILTQAIGLSEKKAHATTLLIMLPLSVVSLVVYILRGNLPWIDSLKIGAGFVVGGIVGAYLLKVISNIWLSIVFSVIIIAGGLKLIL